MKRSTPHSLPRSLLGIGEAMVELAPAEGGLYEMGFAGDVLNTLWYAQSAFRSGATLERDLWQTAFFTATGTDAVSNQMIAFIEGGGINCAHVQQNARRPGHYMIQLENGERSFSYWRGESAARWMLKEPNQLDMAIERSGAIYFSGITLAILAPECRSVLLKRLEGARTRGKIVAFDPNIRPALWENGAIMRETIEAGAAVSTLILPSFDDEKTTFGDETPTDTAKRYETAAGQTVIVKNGPGAVTVRTDGQDYLIDTQPIKNIIDTTAAGDAFNGAFLAANLQGQSLEASVRAGQACAANVIRHRGALIPRSS